MSQLSTAEFPDMEMLMMQSFVYPNIIIRKTEAKTETELVPLGFKFIFPKRWIIAKIPPKKDASPPRNPYGLTDKILAFARDCGSSLHGEAIKGISPFLPSKKTMVKLFIGQ